MVGVTVTKEVPHTETVIADAAAIEAFVREQHGSVSFVQLSRAMESIMPIAGEMAIGLVPNVYIWAGMSERYCDAVRLLMAEKRIELRHASLLVYLVDGGMLKLPTVKRKPPSRGFKKEHWFPVVLYPPKQPPSRVARPPKRRTQSEDG